MKAIELEISNPSGLHARPAAMFVRTAGAQRATILVRNLDRDGAAANAKSLLSVLGLGVSRGHRISIQADGEDEEAAIAALRQAIESGLGEPLDQPRPGESGSDEAAERAAKRPTEA
ncbi:MAG: HPr family phosphocarrier protein [Candidatus Limnocylindrales bacterium]